MVDQRTNPYRRGPRAPRSESDSNTRRGLRELPADLHALADGRENRLRRPYKPRNQALEDDAGRHVIPGVRNSESRTVYDRRVAALRDAAGRDDAETLGLGLFEARCLGLWRARNITDFDAFAENVVGVAPARAQELAAGAAARAGGPVEGPLSPEVVALWVRTEAAVMAVSPNAVVRVAIAGTAPWLEVHVPVEAPLQAVDALKAIGPGITGLGKLFASGEKPPGGPR